MKPVIHPGSLEWWFWPVIFVFLLLGMFGWTNGFYLVILISTIQAIYFIAKEKSLKSFPAQIRFVYLLFTIIGILDPTRV